MRKIRIAQIGMNMYSHGMQIFQRLERQSDAFELVGYCLPENERERIPQKVARMSSCPELTLEEILNDPTIEAVTVETDEIYTVKYALMAAEHGKHIHMEKPGGREPEDFEKLIETVKRKNLIFSTGYMYRHNPCVRRLLERIRSDEMGEIISVEAQMNCIHPPKVREWLNELPGGMMFYLGCHLIDLVLLLQGDPENIIRLNRHSGADGVDSPDFGMAVFEYKNGVSFVKTTAVERGGYMRRQLVVTGTKATVELKPFEYGGTEEHMFTDERIVTSDVWGDDGVTATSESFDRYTNMMYAFAAMVRGEQEPLYTPDYELKLYRTLLYCCGVSEARRV